MAGVALGSSRPARDGAAERRSAAWYAAPAAAILSVGAGYVHLAYTDSHWQDWWAYGLFFLLAGIGQLLFAVLVLRWPSPPLVAAGIAGNLGIVGMYLYSRTEGPPIGPHRGALEDTGAVDLATTAAEIAIAVLLVAMLGGRARRWVLNALLVAGAAVWALRLSGVMG